MSPPKKQIDIIGTHRGETMMMQVLGGFSGMNYDGEYRHGLEKQI
jgi:hypothetical protein